MKKSTKKKLKKIFNLYNLAILVCAILIIVSLIIIIEPDFSGLFTKDADESEAQVVQDDDDNEEESSNSSKTNDVKVVESNNKDDISEDDARSLAKKQFKELGESVKKDELEVLKIQRDGEEYYYISSAENTLEIKISTGEITRINSVKVEE